MLSDLGFRVSSCADGEPRRNRLVRALVGAITVVGLIGWSTASDSESVTAVGSDDYPRIAAMEFIDGAEKYQAILGRALWANRVVGIKDDLASEGRSILALRYFSPRAYRAMT